ncbi:serine/threonine-protein phosphatase 2A activator-like [Rhodnius prolixus]|uniref:Serine/threonine-protein phosphatase 2A activator n=2 Tax=Rhodnius TaxID=13248 RepID=R4G3E0_RHOPR
MVSFFTDFTHVISDDHEFAVPKKAVLTIQDMSNWLKSEAYFEYFGFITAMNEEIKGKTCRGQYPKSPAVEGVLALLTTFKGWVTDIPPIEQPQRFGNKAFRTWYDRLKKEIDELLHFTLADRYHIALTELKYYLQEGFGNATRIDYGTGHEMSFCMFLCGLFKIGAFTEDDKLAVVCYIFPRYLEVVRQLQRVYNMEPAGSRGVWALDDFQFIPFIWGSAQLMDHPQLDPSRFMLPEYIDKYSSDYMFLSCIEYILEVKTGPFAEHSNQLWNISGISSWEKVNSGLIKMYKGEVLSKFPVIQHVLFGTVFSIKEADQQDPNRKGSRVSDLAGASHAP